MQGVTLQVVFKATSLPESTGGSAEKVQGLGLGTSELKSPKEEEPAGKRVKAGSLVALKPGKTELQGRGREQLYQWC